MFTLCCICIANSLFLFTLCCSAYSCLRYAVQLIHVCIMLFSLFMFTLCCSAYSCLRGAVQHIHAYCVLLIQWELLMALR